MTSLDLVTRGAALGFSVAAPVGPIGLLCIQRTLNRGRLHGLAVGLGAATADALYGLVAGLGLTWISSATEHSGPWLRLAGAAFLLFLGARTLRSRPAEHAAQAHRSGIAATYAATVGLTLSNPATILSFSAVFAGLGLSSASGGTSAAALLVTAVFAGSATWWLLLSSATSALREKLQPHLRKINLASGALVCAFGAWALWSAVKML
ncbi:MAG TPA: LysE family transporter [Myxococcales bacterium]|nr:LysE family transporter [Myxococcales bacterium]